MQLGPLGSDSDAMFEVVKISDACFVHLLLQYHHHHLFAQYAEMNSKICNVLDRKANSFSSNNCP